MPRLTRRLTNFFSWHFGERKEFWRNLSKEAVQSTTTSFPTAQKNIVKYGKHFLLTFPKKILGGKKRIEYSIGLEPTSFESPVAISISMRYVRKQEETLHRGNPGWLARIKLGFEKDALILEAFKGRKNSPAHIAKLKNFLGEHWANYLVKLAEEHAKKSGLKQVKIRRPEALYYYEHLAVHTTKARLGEHKTQKAVRDSMRKLYYGVADDLGYREEGNFLVKDL